MFLFSRRFINSTIKLSNKQYKKGRSFGSQSFQSFGKRSSWLPSAVGATLVTGTVFYLANQSLQADSYNNSTPLESDEEICIIDTNYIELANEKVRDLMAIYKEESGSPGVVVGISKNGTTLFAEGIGYADVENQVLMTSETSLRIASISKAFTSIALGLLLEQGKISLEDTVQKYLPDYPVKEEGQITVRHLAAHLSGIRHYKDKKDFKSIIAYKTVMDALAPFKDEQLKSVPGTKYLYTTNGFTLLSAILEKASNQSYVKFMEENVFSPLELTHTQADTHKKIIENRAKNYRRDKSHNLKNSPYADLSCKWAGGGFISTVEDLLKFGNSMIYATLLKPETIKLLWTPQKTNEGKEIEYGLGWQLKKAKIGKEMRYIVSHAGGAEGCTSQLFILPEDEIVIVVVANMYSTKGMFQLCQKIATLYK